MPAPSIRSVAHAAATLGGDPVVTLGTVVDGDLLIALCTSTVAAWTNPAGFSQPTGSLGGVAPLMSKIAAGEGPTITFVASGAGNNEVTVVAVKDHGGIQDVDGTTVGSGNVVIPAGTAAEDDSFYLQMLCRAGGSGTFLAPSGTTERYDTVVAPTTFTAAGGDEIVDTGSTGTRTWTPSSSGSAVGYGIVINPMPAGSFSGGYDFAGSDWLGEEGPGLGQFVGAYDFSGTFEGAAPDLASGSFLGNYDFTGSGFTGDGDGAGGSGAVVSIARHRAAVYLGYSEPALSGMGTTFLLREYWARRAGIAGDLSAYSIADIMQTHFPQFDYIKDVF